MNDIKYFDKTIELVEKIKATQDVFPRYGGHVGFHPLMDSRLMWSNVIGIGRATSTIAAICVSQAFSSETALRLQEMGEQLHIFVSPNVVEVPQTNNDEVYAVYTKYIKNAQSV